jgi:hypothetical protein
VTTTVLVIPDQALILSILSLIAFFVGTSSDQFHNVASYASSGTVISLELATTHVHFADIFRLIFVSSHVALIDGQLPVAALPIVTSLTAVVACVNLSNSLFALSSIGWFAASTRAVLVDVPIVTLPFPLPLITAFTFALSPAASKITDVQEAFVILQ